MPLARALVREGSLGGKHLAGSASAVESIQKALADIVSPVFGDTPDHFSIEVGITDGLDEYRRPKQDVIFFIWNNTNDTQYVPLRPVYELLDGHSQRESLMASLYLWLHRTASTVFEPFGFPEAKRMYQWRRDAYMDEREAGEDVDLEGEVEYANPEKVVRYIRESCKLRLKTADVPAAISSIADLKLREAFRNARQIYLDSRAIRLPRMTDEYAQLVDDAAYYMDSSPLPGLGISHWRDDPIVAWLDEFCRDQFESGTSPRAPLVLCFRPTDIDFFIKIVRNLPRMARTVAALSEWVGFAEELENAGRYADRDEP